MAPKLGAPGEANQNLLKFMAKFFDVPLRHVSLLGGTICRDKRTGIEAPCHLPEGVTAPEG
jgi:uncharacterized protein YggU (UPF0235/DUF167 family)